MVLCAGAIAGEEHNLGSGEGLRRDRLNEQSFVTRGGNPPARLTVVEQLQIPDRKRRLVQFFSQILTQQARCAYNHTP